MLRTADASESGDTEVSKSPDLDPIAEPALAALMALVLSDVLPPDVFDELTRAVATAMSISAHGVGTGLSV
jgi:hypothetical protein